jgi:hypothetical protein
MPVFFLLSFCCTGYHVRLPRLATVPRARSPRAASPCVPTPACSPRSHAVCALAPIGCRARSPRSCAHPSWLLYMSAVAPTHPVVVPCAYVCVCFIACWTLWTCWWMNGCIYFELDVWTRYCYFELKYWIIWILEENIWSNCQQQRTYWH